MEFGCNWESNVVGERGEPEMGLGKGRTLGGADGGITERPSVYHPRADVQASSLTSSVLGPTFSRAGGRAPTLA